MLLWRERERTAPAGQRILGASGGGVQVALLFDQRRVPGGDQQARADRAIRRVPVAGAQAGEGEQPIPARVARILGDPLLVACEHPIVEILFRARSSGTCQLQ